MKPYTRARIDSGLEAFELSDCRLVLVGGLLISAWRVPGTEEHARWWALTLRCADLTHRYSKDVKLGHR